MHVFNGLGVQWGEGAVLDGHMATLSPLGRRGKRTVRLKVFMNTQTPGSTRGHGGGTATEESHVLPLPGLCPVLWTCHGVSQRPPIEGQCLVFSSTAA